MQKITVARPARGISRLEVLASTVIILIFVSLLLDRLFYYQEQSEKAVMEMTARQLDSMLRIRAAELMLANRAADLAQLERTNPFTLFAVPPARYGGESEGDAAAEAGVWHYERQRAELAYVPAGTRHLSIDGGGNAIRYRVRLLRAAPDNHVAGARLEQLTRYRWFE